MSKCPNCQLDNEDDANVCYSCGARIPKGQTEELSDDEDEGGVSPSSPVEIPPEHQASWQEVIAAYDEAIRIDPEDSEAYLNRGLAYDSVGQLEHAIEDYDMAIRINPADVDAYINRGEAYSDLGQYEKAVRDYEKAIEIDSEHAEAYFSRGNTYISLGDYQSAVEDYRKTTFLDPDDAEAYAHAALAATLLSRDEEAEEFAGQAIDREFPPSFLQIVMDELKRRR